MVRKNIGHQVCTSGHFEDFTGASRDNIAHFKVHVEYIGISRAAFDTFTVSKSLLSVSLINLECLTFVVVQNSFSVSFDGAGYFI